MAAPKNHPPRSDFDELMSIQGVRRLGAPPPPRPAPKAPPAVAPKAPAPPPIPPALQGLLDEANRRAAAAEARAQAAEAAATAAQAQARAAEAATAAAQAQASAAEARATEADAHRKALQRKLDTPTAAPPAPSLAGALDDRGLRREEFATALAQLAMDRPPAIEALVSAADGAAQRLILEEHLCLRCAACPPGAGPLAFPVEPARCERCGGSDIQRAAEAFRAAAQGAGVERVVVVGGSPAYSRQLASLFPGTFLRFVEGWKKYSADKAKVDMKWAQVVFRWGGTMLNHSVADQYVGAQVHTISHRGITVFLDKAAAHLRSR